MVIQLKKETDLKGFYKDFLMQTSINLPEDRRLTDMEANIMSELWMFEKGIRFTPDTKKLIREMYGFKNYSNIENYLKILMNKGFLNKVDRGYEIKKGFDLPKPNRGVEIKYVYKIV